MWSAPRGPANEHECETFGVRGLLDELLDLTADAAELTGFESLELLPHAEQGALRVGVAVRGAPARARGGGEHRCCSFASLVRGVVVEPLGSLCALALERALRRERPSQDRVVHEHLDHCEESLFVAAEHAHRLLAATTHHPFNTAHSHAVHDVSCEAEGDLLRRGQAPPLLEGNSEIDLDELSARFVDENVGWMAIPEPDGVAHHRVDRHRARVREPLRVPFRRAVEVLEEEVVHDGLEVRAHLGVHVRERRGSWFALVEIFLRLLEHLEALPMAPVAGAAVDAMGAAAQLSIAVQELREW
mmetsp:Transcript_11723/g.38550  ORF Transcript_11723/g.38550 Transcript_11723/m.38550 type:complete len:302 (-) Transcript_11723:1520-2425(-)